MGQKEQWFARLLLQELKQRDPRAVALQIQQAPRAKKVSLGIVDDGEFVPLLGLDNASAAVNVMSLWVWHHRQWKPTFHRGTPAELAEHLVGPLHFLWTIAVDALGHPFSE
jgi:hypothetical protein